MLRRLGINLLYLVPEQVGGTEIVARCLVPALAAERPSLEIVVFCGQESAATLPDPSWPASIRVVPLPIRSARKPLRLATELVALPTAAAHHGVQLLHSLGTTAPLHGSFARVVTIHDLIYHWWPEAFPRPARIGLETIVPLAARHSHRVQVLSSATRGELIETLGIPAEKIDIVPNGRGMRDVGHATPPDQLRARLQLGDARVVLSVAAALPHKNLERLLEAFAGLGTDRDVALVLTGHAGRVTEALRARAASLGIADRVRFTGWVSDADVEGLYVLADAFAYPSLHEGFGMPVLEAMHRGTPVVSSDATSLPEVAGNAALVVNARDPVALSGALARVLDDGDLRADLVQRGRLRAAEFTWSRTARAALASYDRALGSIRTARTP